MKKQNLKFQFSLKRIFNLVSQQAGVDEEKAKNALEEAEGDLAERSYF